MTVKKNKINMLDKALSHADSSPDIIFNQTGGRRFGKIAEAEKHIDKTRILTEFAKDVSHEIEVEYETSILMGMSRDHAIFCALKVIKRKLEAMAEVTDISENELFTLFKNS